MRCSCMNFQIQFPKLIVIFMLHLDKQTRHLMLNEQIWINSKQLLTNYVHHNTSLWIVEWYDVYVWATEWCCLVSQTGHNIHHTTHWIHTIHLRTNQTFKHCFVSIILTTLTSWTKQKFLRDLMNFSTWFKDGGYKVDMRISIALIMIVEHKMV